MAKDKYDFGGWATKYNIRCSDRRTILQDAFKDNDGQQIPLVWNHNHTDAETVLGHAVLENRKEGVYAYCYLNDTQQGRNAKELVKHGDVSALSIYANKLKQNGDNVVHGAIKEVSLVLAGANPGAYIDTVIAHSENSDEEAVIYNNAKDLKMSEEGENQMEKENITKTDPNDEVKHSEDTKNQEDVENSEEKKSEDELKHAEADKTIKDVWDGMSEEQQNVCAALIEGAVELDREKRKEPKSEDKEMKHNAFEENEKDVNKENNKDTLSHSEFCDIIKDAKRIGSVKEAFLQHGITNVENLFPDAHNVDPTPKVVDMKHDWVNVIISGVHNIPFARIKSQYADLTPDAARAKGYVKGNQKVEEVIAVAKRETDPTTVYKLQKMDRDDVVDIVDFDVLAWLKAEMSVKLKEEIARAILVGDGRLSSDADKINPTHIRPIVDDNAVYTIQAKTYESATTIDNDAEHFIDDVVIAMDDYKGSGNVTMFVRRDMLTKLLLLKDTMGHRLYKSVNEIANAMTVDRIVSVPKVVMNAQGIYGIALDLSDYYVGKARQGQTTFFDDFDLNYNKYEYLIETRCSGALVTPYSALVFKKAAAEPEPGK